MKGLLTAAAILVLAVLAPVRALAAAPVCDQLTGGLGLCVPRYGTSFDNWARADIAALTLINSGSTSATTTTDWLQVRRISGVSTGTPNIHVSSYTLFSGSASISGAGGLGVTYGVSAGSFTAPGSVLSSTIAVLGDGSWAMSDTGATQSYLSARKTGNTAIIESTGGQNLTLRVNGGTGNIVLSPSNTNETARFSSTGLSVHGSSFTVGASTLVASGGKVGIATASPATTLDVNGSAQFGSGAAKSTFSTTGALTLASGVALTASSATFNGTSGAYNITSSTGVYIDKGWLRFGSGAGIEWSNGVKQTSMTAGGGSVTLASTGSFRASDYTPSSTAGVAFDTQTITCTGGRYLRYNFMGSIRDDGGSAPTIANFLFDGAYVDGFTGTKGMATTTGALTIANVEHMLVINHKTRTTTCSAGTHQVAISVTATGGTHNLQCGTRGQCTWDISEE